ncbi:MAG TPA: DUF6048 family protein [Bacteroidales bacterium]|nr:DUF6048 family protein [Bacteroidales bacterium]HQB86042.1 DUF6048 family protein [Bacteroidales bacterium]
MRKIFVYFISLLLIIDMQGLRAQDTVLFPLKIRAGFDLIGPGFYFNDRTNMNMEGFISYDRNEKLAYVLESGYSDYKYSQYNYDYNSRGAFARLGLDLNLLKPDKAGGKYWAGLGFRYGMSIFDSQTTAFKHENYWGETLSSIPAKKMFAHYIEVAPGVKTEVFKNFSMGWTIRLKMLLSGGGGKHLKPISVPGYGNGGRMTNAGISYFIVWNIPYRTKTVIIKPELPSEEDEEYEETDVSTGQQRIGF